MADNKKKDEHDIMDDVRKAERVVKSALLVKRLTALRGIARAVLEFKEKSMMMLEEIGVSDKDAKRIVSRSRRINVVTFVITMYNGGES